MSVRVPAWTWSGARLDGAEVSGGYAVVSGVLSAGETHVLELDMSPRLTVPDPRIDAVRGCVAVERGPLVLCAESVDLPEGMSLDEIALVPGAAPAIADDGAVVVPARRVPEAARRWPYSEAGSHQGCEEGGDQPAEVFDLPLIPYYSWANRGPATMRVWLPRAEA